MNTEFNNYFQDQTKFDDTEPKVHYSTGLELCLYSNGWRITFAGKCFSDRWWNKGDHNLLVNNNCFHKMKYLPEGHQQTEAVEKWATDQPYDKEIFDSINFIPNGFICR